MWRFATTTGLASRTSKGLCDVAIRRPTTPGSTVAMRSSIAAWWNVCSHLYQAILAGRPAETSGVDNLKTLAMVDAAYEAAESQSVVHLRLATTVDANASSR